MKNKSQSVLEYAIVLGLVIFALSAMALYFRRGIQSVIKVAADEVGSQKDAEEIDPLKGSKTSSSINRQLQMTQTGKVAAGNERQSGFNVVSSTSGTSTSVYTQEK
jgi:uncharacterized protein (UPF0333 family)